MKDPASRAPVLDIRTYVLMWCPGYTMLPIVILLRSNETSLFTTKKTYIYHGVSLLPGSVYSHTHTHTHQKKKRGERKEKT